MSALPSPINLIPADAPFDAAQRAWLNGFFNALLTQPRAAAPSAAGEPAVAGKTITLAHASQTGTAESWSKKFAKRLKAQGMATRVVELQSLAFADLAKEDLLLVLASTYGEGDPPDPCASFAAQLQTPGDVSLHNLQYAVLALGDRNYVHFCAFGHAIDEAFEKMGATRIAPVCEIDNGADAPWKAWQEQMLSTLPPLAGSSGAANGLTGADEPEEEDANAHIAGLSREHPFGATLLSNRRLNHVDSDKETRHIVLSLSGANWQYEPGDALGVWPRNARAAVERLISGLELSPDAVVLHERRALSLSETLYSACEICRMTTAVVLRFARHFEKADLIALCEGDDSKALTDLIYGLDALKLSLLIAPPKAFTAQLLVDLLAPLAPRLYSISSSIRAHPAEVHLTVALARFEVENEERDGLASAYLAHPERLLATVPVYIHRNARFRLPADVGVPVIMIGPGTGIAPFRSFLEERHAKSHTGRTWLFFGDRHAATDFLYREELEAYLASGTLTRLDTAFSRDSNQKIYVQQRMLEHGAEIWSWLTDGAAIYICGDASRMAKDVDQALQQILVSHGHMSEATAQLELRHWGATGRYLRDVY